MIKMKKILILHILLCIFTLNCNAQMYSTSPYIQKRAGYSNSSYQQTNTSQQSLGYREGSRIGYTIQYSGVYTPNTSLSYEEQEAFIPAQSSYVSGPRKAPSTHGEGSETVIVDGYSATISWSVDADFLGWFLWTITYSDGTTESFTGTFNQAKAHAASVAEEKARAQAEKNG